MSAAPARATRDRRGHARGVASRVRLRRGRRAGVTALVLLAAFVLPPAPARAAPHAAAASKRSAAASKPAPRTKPSLKTFSNANDVEAIAIDAGRLYAATAGGVVAWDIASGRMIRKWTSLDGLLGNHAYSIAVCPLPEPRVAVGTVDGLNLLDPARERWEAMTPGNSDLAAAAVTCLAPDPRHGALYIGFGYAGLNVLEGRTRSWRHIATVNGLLANRVEGMAVANGGQQVWVAARSGVSLVDAKGVTVYSARDIGTTSPLSGAIAAGPPGTMWAITADGTLIRFANGKWKLYGAGEVPGQPLRARAGIVASADGTLWFQASNGDICHFDPASGKCATAGRVPSTGGATALLPAPDGTLFVATHEGVMALDPRRGGGWRTFTVEGDPLRNNRIQALAEAAGGPVWIGTEAGTYTVDPAAPGSTMRPVGKPGDRVWRGGVNTLYADPRGGMWLGTPGGAGYLNRSTWKWLGRPEGLVNDTVSAIARDAKGRMWFGTIRGISVWDGKAMRNLTARDGLPSERIHALLARGAVVYAGTENSMLRFDGPRFEVLDDDAMGVEFESMRRIAPYRRDSLVVGTSNGLGFIDGRTGRDDPEVYGDAITAIAVGPRDELWVGTELRGVFHRDARGWENLTILDGLPSNRISALLVDRLGAVWIGTDDAGLARYSRPAAAPARGRTGARSR
jgi:ligand-binding sensor domain-containing protein